MRKILCFDSVTFTYRVGSIEKATSDTGFLFRGMQKACNSLTQQDALFGTNYVVDFASNCRITTLAGCEVWRRRKERGNVECVQSSMRSMCPEMVQ